MTKDTLDADTADALAALVAKAKTLIGLWEDDLRRGIDRSAPPSHRSDFLSACEIVTMDVDAWSAARAALAAVRDDRPVELSDGATTLGRAAKRVRTLGDLARRHLGAAGQAHDDALAPYRALLRNDKLSVFEEHPANEYRYYTTGRKIIESPEELAQAPMWYFEGSSQTRSSGTFDGGKVDVTVEGWRVLGYRFDDDHNLVEEFEETGAGRNAPKKAFSHP